MASAESAPCLRGMYEAALREEAVCLIRGYRIILPDSPQFEPSMRDAKVKVEVKVKAGR